jgi:hypothetical protein
MRSCCGNIVGGLKDPVREYILTFNENNSTEKERKGKEEKDTREGRRNGS